VLSLKIWKILIVPTVLHLSTLVLNHIRLIYFQNLETQTIPPPRANFSGQVTQWIIYDAYQQDFEAQQREKKKEKKDKVVPTQKLEVKRKDLQVTSDRTLLAIKTLERMINQNTFDEIAQGV
jgi:dynein intermediate chain 1